MTTWRPAKASEICTQDTVRELGEDSIVIEVETYRGIVEVTYEVDQAFSGRQTTEFEADAELHILIPWDIVSPAEVALRDIVREHRPRVPGTAHALPPWGEVVEIGRDGPDGPPRYLVILDVVPTWRGGPGPAERGRRHLPCREGTQLLRKI